MKLDNQTIMMVVVAIVLGMLVANMVKDVCGCKVVEGQRPAGFVACTETGDPNCRWLSNSMVKSGTCDVDPTGRRDNVLNRSCMNGTLLSPWNNVWQTKVTIGNTPSPNNWMESVCCGKPSESLPSQLVDGCVTTPASLTYTGSAVNNWVNQSVCNTWFGIDQTSTIDEQNALCAYCAGPVDQVENNIKTECSRCCQISTSR